MLWEQEVVSSNLAAPTLFKSMASARLPDMRSPCRVRQPVNAWGKGRPTLKLIGSRI